MATDIGNVTGVASIEQTGDERLAAARPYLVTQDWSAYTPAQHAVWTELVSRRMPELELHACAEYLDGFKRIGLQEDAIPKLAEVNRRLGPRTGWNARPVSGYLPAPAFFEMLAMRQFPTTISIRGMDSLEYIPEPDIFHDVFGHVPMHAHPVFADFLQHYGQVCTQLTAEEDLLKMGRLFWFTVEFGVIRQQGEIKLYGSGLISSHGEARYVIEGGPEIRPFNLDAVMAQDFSISEMQKVLYAVESFEEIYEATKEAERRLG